MTPIFYLYFLRFERFIIELLTNFVPQKLPCYFFGMTEDINDGGKLY